MRVRFTTAAELVNELTEAKDKSELNRVTARWIQNELIVVDEMAYVAMPEAAAEYLFQIISGRAERPAVIATTNLPLSERTTMFPNAQLCKVMLEERWRVGKEASDDVVSDAFAVCDDGGS